MTAQQPGPAVDLIEHAARVIVAEKRKPYTGPYHWAGALWEAGMIVPPGGATDPPLTALIDAVLVWQQEIPFPDELDDRERAMWEAAEVFVRSRHTLRDSQDRNEEQK